MTSTIAIPATMTAIVAKGKGGPEILQPETVPVPHPRDGEVLVKVAAAGVNRPDVLQRQGLYPAPKGHSELLGLEIAGEVVALGAGVANVKVGDAVMALVNGGGYAEYCLADAGVCLPVPPNLTLTEAAAIPETAMTVWHNVFERGALKNGEWLLVHGGTSGIGVSAIQFAKAFGAHVIATAGSVEKCQAIVRLGADRAVNYKTEDYVEVVKSVTDGRGVDVILDMVGADYIERNIKCAADDARIVNIGYQRGSKVTLDFMRVMLKRLTLTGSTLRIRTKDVKEGIAAAVAANIVPLFADSTVTVVLDRTFPLTEAAAAHARMEAGDHIGKIVLVVAQP